MDIKYVAIVAMVVIAAVAVMAVVNAIGFLFEVPGRTQSGSVGDCKNLGNIGNCYSNFMPPRDSCGARTDYCVAGLAINRDDPTLCGTLQNKDAADGCIYLIAVKKNNTEDCNRINNTYLRGKCLTGTGGSATSVGGNEAGQVDDTVQSAPELLLGACTEMSEPEMRSRCFTTFAINNKDPLSCEGADGTYVSNGLTFFYKYSCYYYSSIEQAKL